MSCKVAATKSRKVAATKSRKVAATKSSKTNLNTKNSQAATIPQLAPAAKPHACCLFAAIHCEKPFIFIRADEHRIRGIVYKPSNVLSNISSPFEPNS